METIERYRGKNYLLNIMDEYNNYTDFRSRINRALKLIGPYKRVGKGGKKEYTPIMNFL